MIKPAGEQYKQTCRLKTWICGTQWVMVFSLMAETRVLKQLRDGDRTTSDGKLFHNVTVAGNKLNRYASTRTVGTKNLVLWPQVSRVFHCKFGCSGIATKPWTIQYSMVALERSLRSSKESQPKYCNIDDGLSLTTSVLFQLPAAG